MSLNEEQVRALSSLAEALKGTTIEDLIKANTNLGNQEKKSAAALQDLEESTTPIVGIQALIALHADTTVPRTLATKGSYFVPTFNKMFYILNAIDTHMSDNFYARRFIPHMFPSVSRLYISILALAATLRVQNFANSISASDKAFIEDFFEAYPPATLPIPGPLMPLFKAICVSHPENANQRRLIPALPKLYPLLPTSATDPSLTSKILADRYNDENHIDFLVPFPPYIAHFHHLLMVSDPAIGLTAGADDSADATAHTKTVTATTNADYKNMVDLLNHPRATIRREFFPFKVSPAANAVANTQAADYTQYTRNIFGTPRPSNYTNIAQEARQSFLKLGLNEPIKVNSDLISQFKKSFASLEIPEPQEDDNYNYMSDVFMMTDSFEWFGPIIGEMSAYCKLLPDSGCLQDCSLTGPRMAQYVNKIDAPGTPLAPPAYFGDDRANVRYNHTLHTSIHKEERIVEMTAAYACINMDAQNVLARLPDLGHQGTRAGDFWNIAPVYDAGPTDIAWIQTSPAIKKQILERPDSKK